MSILSLSYVVDYYTFQFCYIYYIIPDVLTITIFIAILLYIRLFSEPLIHFVLRAAVNAGCSTV